MPGVHHKPTAKTKKLVGDLVLLDLGQNEIAKRVGICVETLVSHYYYEIYELKHDINCEIANIALNKARGGEWKAIKFWLKSRAGFSDARLLDAHEISEKSLIEKLIDKIPNNERNNDSESIG